MLIMSTFLQTIGDQRTLTSLWVQHQAARVRRLSPSGLLWLAGSLIEFVVIMRHLVTVMEVNGMKK